MTERKRKLRDDLASTIGAHARTARLQLRLTQADVAELVGIASEVYGRLERGFMLPSVETLAKLASVLGTSADELLGLREATRGIVGHPLVLEGSQAFRLLVRRVRKLKPAKVRLLATIAGAFVKKDRP